MQALTTAMSGDGWKTVLGGDMLLQELGITGVSNMIITNPTISKDDDKKKLAIGLGVGLGVGIPVVAAVVAFFVMRRKDQNVSPGAAPA
jgi:hypothetical protein